MLRLLTGFALSIALAVPLTAPLHAQQSDPLFDFSDPIRPRPRTEADVPQEAENARPEVVRGPKGSDGGVDLPLGTAEQTTVTRAAEGNHAVLRTLDKISGQVRDVTLNVGQSAQIGRLNVALRACRYPQSNPTGNAFAYLEITDTKRGGTPFRGWMIAQAPALNALDDPRYDVWVLGCAA